jgi:hypothetical protein
VGRVCVCICVCLAYECHIDLTTVLLELLRLDGLGALALLEATHWLTSVRLGLTTTGTARWLAHTADSSGTATHQVSMDSTRDAVLSLDVHLWDDVGLVHGSLLHITLTGRLNHVTHKEAGYSLVLWAATSTVIATDGTDMSAALAVLSIVTALLGHVWMRIRK